MKILISVIPWSKKIDVKKTWTDLLTSNPTYRVKLTAKPIDGKANKQLIPVLADYFWVKKRQINLLKGGNNRLKLIKIDN